MVNISDPLSKDDVLQKSRKYNPLGTRYGYVYFLINNGEIVYVGQTMYLEQRLKAHCKKKDFDSFACIKVLVKQLLKTEAYYIGKFEPIYNTVLPIHRGAYDSRPIEIPDEEPLRLAYLRGLDEYERIMKRMVSNVSR